ncbi:cysteine desulfurase family protein [Phytoactinopolyspora mesophila]|uniref:Aminotransferase class V-fold PLP-dependent enzyme n=1 Tax=Phytoactinopolyspora mesophila TaxID=2650750 RepID=A0A7K3M702_9ACTN|nr:cysteine desulfurase family protein [Phytoactinopolyspora mesophila]NDL59103.1 aminotransferase class V-fold PLP-dependent enzyme [Phytoactinopolyspora mesophila]
MSERQVYLDHAATSPILPEVIEVVAEVMATVGNPSSLHAAGRQARKIVEESRETVAGALGARPSEVVFTSGGTEADNLAVKGLYWSRRAADPRRVRILASAVEHHAVMDAVQWLGEAQGAEVEWLPVDAHGALEVAALREAVAREPESVALITVMWANNEIGTVQPIDQIVPIAAEYGIPVHSDAVQVVGHLPVDFSASGLDTLTISGHKIGGPIGVGALLVRREIELTPVQHGGGQERDVRSGTLDAPSFAGLATAVDAAAGNIAARAEHLGQLRDLLAQGVLSAVPDAVRNGVPDRSLPSIAHFSFPGCDGDSLLLLLDAAGIHCSTGSACTAGVQQPSHVLLAMGVDPEVARDSLRFSLGHTSTRADVEALIESIGPAVSRARKAGLSGTSKR